MDARSISVRFGAAQILDDVDLAVDAGEWLAVIGPNGAGKSTLLKAAGGLVEYSGRVTTPWAASERARHLALVPQRPLIPSEMTVAGYVLLGRTAHLGWFAREGATDHAAVASALERLDLSHLAGRRMGGLSGGETQRVVLARALTQEAELLLLDEPTSALDLGHEHQVLELVDDLRRTDRLGVVSVMHDLTTAGRYADRLLLLKRGRVAAEGTPGEVLVPELLSRVYGTELEVVDIGGDRLVMPMGPRPRGGARSEHRS